MTFEQAVTLVAAERVRQHTKWDGPPQLGRRGLFQLQRAGRREPWPADRTTNSHGCLPDGTHEKDCGYGGHG